VAWNVLSAGAGFCLSAATAIARSSLANQVWRAV